MNRRETEQEKNKWIWSVPISYSIANSDGVVHTHWDSYRIVSSDMGGACSTNIW